MRKSLSRSYIAARLPLMTLRARRPMPRPVPATPSPAANPRYSSGIAFTNFAAPEAVLPTMLAAPETIPLPIGATREPTVPSGPRGTAPTTPVTREPTAPAVLATDEDVFPTKFHAVDNQSGTPPTRILPDATASAPAPRSAALFVHLLRMSLLNQLRCSPSIRSVRYRVNSALTFSRSVTLPLASRNFRTNLPGIMTSLGCSSRRMARYSGISPVDLFTGFSPGGGGTSLRGGCDLGMVEGNYANARALAMSIW